MYAVVYGCTSLFAPGFWGTNGWGFGLAVATAPDKISAIPGRFGWDGGYGTAFIADPAVGLVAIRLAQRVMQSQTTQRSIQLS